MKENELQEIGNLPPQYRPLGAWAYVGYTILFSLGFIGFICVIVFSFNDSNIIRRSFARSFFCAYLILFVIVAILIAIAFIVFLGI